MPIESKTRKIIDQIQFVMLDMPVKIVVCRYIYITVSMESIITLDKDCVEN